MKWEYFGTGLTFLGIGITLVLALPPPWWPNMPRWAIRVGLVSGLALIVYGAAFTAMGIWPETLRPKLLPVLAMCLGLIILLAGTIWFFRTDSKGHHSASPIASFSPPKETSTPIQLPDVTARLIYTDRPALVLINNSEKTASQIKWTAVLWNMDDPRLYISAPDPEGHDALPIPIATFDFIRPHSASGPQSLVGRRELSDFVKDGQRFVGSFSVVCPDCQRGYTYVTSFVIGKGGWYSLVDQPQDGSVIIPVKLHKKEVNEYAKVIESVPVTNRMPILEH